MSTPYFCRSSRTVTDRRGQALVLALVLMIVALPTAIYTYNFVATSLKVGMAERRQKVASELANGAMTDYFRQFSQDVYSGHYDPDALARPKSFYSAGYSTVTFVPDSINHTVYVRAQGVYGTPESPKTTRTLEGLIRFYSDQVRFGTMINGPFTIGVNDVVYSGGFYVNGNLTISASGVTFNGGPVIVNGNVSGAASNQINGNLYYTGASQGSVTVTGKTYRYIPAVNWPTLDFNYYAANCTYTTAVDQTIVFNSTQSFTVVGGATYAIPPQGAMIYAANANLTIKGAVSGPITVVAGADTLGGCSSAKGKITVADNVYYAGASSITASASASFAALASNCVSFNKTGADLLAAGVYFVQQGTSNMRANGSNGRKFKLYGVRTQGISVSGFTGGISLVYDQNLRTYQPPGLPEKALLVGWDLH